MSIFFLKFFGINFYYIEHRKKMSCKVWKLKGKIQKAKDGKETPPTPWISGSPDGIQGKECFLGHDNGYYVG
jgi:hypothetical protein